MNKLHRPAPSPRATIHTSFCPALGGCRYVGGSPSAEGADKCAALEEMLVYNDEMLLHLKAREFEAEGERFFSLREGLARAAVLTDPYVKIDAFDPENDERHPSVARPDCPGCVRGDQHYHRVSDGSLVRRPVLPQEG